METKKPLPDIKLPCGCGKCNISIAWSKSEIEGQDTSLPLFEKTFHCYFTVKLFCVESHTGFKWCMHTTALMKLSVRAANQYELLFFSCITHTVDPTQSINVSYRVKIWSLCYLDRPALASNNCRCRKSTRTEILKGLNYFKAALINIFMVMNLLRIITQLCSPPQTCEAF